MTAVTILHGDCREVLPTLDAESVDAVVCDPPYHLHSIVKRFAKTGRTESTRTSSGPHQRTARGFMGKVWDGGDVAFRVETWAEVLRVLKPGGYILAFSSSRTFGRMSVAIEDAGFITHPFIAWVFGQGFPKAHRVNDPAWEGWRYGGQALKPAIEPIYMGQKPFSEVNGTANVLKYGTGAINIDGCRVGTTKDVPASVSRKAPANCYGKFAEYGETQGVGGHDPNLGRWPANLITDGSEEVLDAFPDAPGQQADISLDAPSAKTGNVYGKMNRHGEKSADARYHDRGSTDFAALPGMRRKDGGSAARFFYAAKADKSDRLESKHATVKPVDLISYLCRLITPPGGLILDPFAGSGTVAMAAMREGFKAILIEKELEYVEDVRRRIAHVSGQDAPLFASAAS